MLVQRTLFISLLLLLQVSCTEEPVKEVDILIQLSAARVGTVSILSEPDPVPFDKPLILTFSVPIKPILPNEEVKIVDDNGAVNSYTASYLDGNKTISMNFDEGLNPNTNYQVVIGKIAGQEGGEFTGLTLSFTTLNDSIILEGITIDGTDWNLQFRETDIEFEPEIKVKFSDPLNEEALASNFKLFGGNVTNTLNFTLSVDKTEVTINPQNPLPYYTKYTFRILNNELSADNYEFESTDGVFYTKLDNTLKFPEISDDDLLTKIQEETFKYFWDFGHPVSGLARERNTSGETVTIGGSGFGVMSILVGIERGFISRPQGVERLTKIVNFLSDQADRFHGVWPHWMDGTTGVTRPFSAKDDGADLVESAFMIQGLLTVREYLNVSEPDESTLIDSITTLWEEVEWDSTLR